MSDTVSPLILKPNANNPVNRPEMTDALRQSITAKRNAVEKLLADAVTEFGRQGEITFANSMGAEFVAGPCPDPSFEDLGRIGCCVTAGSFTRTCYYGDSATPTSTYETLCQASGCTFVPG